MKFLKALFLLCLIASMISCGVSNLEEINVDNSISSSPLTMSAPHNIKVTEHEAKIYLNWSSLGEAAYYKVYLNTETNADLDTINPDVTQVFDSITDTKLVLSDLSRNKTYFAVIASINDVGDELRSIETIISLLIGEINEDLDPLNNITITENQGIIELNWSTLPRALNYVIYYSDSDTQVSPGDASQIREIATPPFIHKNLIQGQTYYYRISAVTPDGLTPPSDVKSEKLESIPASSADPTTVPPAVPQGFSATAGDGLVALKWAPITHAASYTVYMAEESIINIDNVNQLEGGETLSNIITISTNRLELVNNTTYYFRVVSFNQDGMRSDASPELAVTPKSKLTPALVPTPTNIGAESIENGVIVSWNKVTDASSYTVYWSTNPDADKLSASAVTNLINNRYQHKSLNSTDVLYFFVTATIDNDESENSAMVSAAPFVPSVPPAPENITAAQTVEGLKIQWDTVSDVEEYILYLATEPGISDINYVQLQNGIRLRYITDNYFVKTSLSPGKQYFARVSAVNTNGEGPLSTEISIRISQPLIILLGDNPITLYQGETFIDPGWIATENEFNDLKNQVITEDTVDTNTPGTYIVKYNVSNQYNVPAPKQQRTVNVILNNSPVIELSGDNPASLTLNQPFADPGAAATDVEDGDLSNNISVTGTIDNTQTGSYTLTYSVTDSLGKSTSIKRRIIVSNPEQPIITLSGDNPLILYVGDSYIESGASAVDSEDTDISDQISIDVSTVDTNKEGNYQVTYNVSDSSGNAATTVSRDVIVYDFNIEISALDFLNLNQSHSLTATLVYSAGQMDITESVNWSTLNNDILSLSNEAGSKGQINALSVGTALIDIDFRDRFDSTTIEVIKIPAPPLGLKATNSGFGSIQLQWLGSDYANSYSIYRKVNENAFVPFSTTPIPFTTLTDFDVEPGITYSYYVVANNIHGSSIASEHVSQMLPE